MNKESIEEEIVRLIKKVFNEQNKILHAHEITICEHSGIVFDKEGNYLDFI